MDPSIFSTQPDFQAKEGQLWRAGTTPNNPLAAAIVGAFAETAALALLRNMDTNTLSQGGKIIVPRYIRLIPTVIPASGTDFQIAIAVDDQDRFSSGGSQIGVAANTFVGKTRSDALADASQLRIDAGAVVTTAAGTRRKFIYRRAIKRAALVVGDEIVIAFADMDGDTPQLLTGASAQILPSVCAPVALMPGGSKVNGQGNHSLAVHWWSTSNAVTGPSFEYEFGYLEKSF